MPQSLDDAPFDVSLKGLANHLLDGCIALARPNADRYILHPLLHLIDMQQERGHGQQIECAIFYSDLRSSVALSKNHDTQNYIDTSLFATDDFNMGCGVTASPLAPHILRGIDDPIRLVTYPLR